MDTGTWRNCVASGMWVVTALAGLMAGPASAADYSESPPGGRQIEYKGKFWPPFPRPVGKEAKLVHQYHYAHYWPYPQNCEDIQSVRNALSVQTTNGWVEGTTLFNYHFNPETHQLNSSGMAHLEYVLYRTPLQYRTAFIQMTNPQVDQLRLIAVQNAAASLLNDGSLPPIVMRRARAYGTNAAEVDAISRKYIGSTPVPRLSGGSAGGGSSQGAGGGGAPQE